MAGKQVVVAEGPVAWKFLNGIFSVYKPREISLNQVKSAIITNLCRTLNELEPRPVSKFVEINGTPDDLQVLVRPDYADHPLVVGPRYQPQDIRLTWATRLGPQTSGVLVMGINNGTRKAMDFNLARFLRTFRLKGLLGQATDNMFINGRVLEKAKFDHVKRHHIDRVLATFQAAHQKQMFVQSGVDIQSQSAYDLAVKGTLRPEKKDVPFIYNFSCVSLEPPNFEVEVQCVNETEDYLLNLIHDIGGRLRTLATCTGLQCIRHGCFTTEHSLLRRYWTVEHILSNISLHQRIFKESNLNLKHEPFLIRNKPISVSQ